jgi:hypothetical protein
MKCTGEKKFGFFFGTLAMAHQRRLRAKNDEAQGRRRAKTVGTPNTPVRKTRRRAQKSPLRDPPPKNNIGQKRLKICYCDRYQWIPS